MNNEMTRNWIRVGVGCGFLASAAYPTLLLAPLPLQIAAVFVCMFGTSLGIASYGLFRFLTLHRSAVSAQIGVISNIVAGAVFTLMGVVQLSLRYAMQAEDTGLSQSVAPDILQRVWYSTDSVHLGLDVVWDAFFVIGTLLLAWNMRSHPRLGGVFAYPGLLIATALLILNFATFPTPPGQANLVDLGPLAGIWYFIVTIQVLRSLKWADSVIDDQRSQ